ncbi:hypothetical protein HJB72_28415 [Rhizobium lentis]|uniref:hypothetical protein n=1 Tax=Rhizobium lentis TaxID=1138194 RepID=UPI001C83FF44|nr:hypothetical protein [Rhizobium lentis]MBX5001849.1 hypothetical protein [Rhizobium lentis]
MASKEIDDGGAAFPIVEAGPYSKEGMSLRDWFAGQALNGLLASESDDQIYPTLGCAQRAYAMADAMISVRKAGG